MKYALFFCFAAMSCFGQKPYQQLLDDLKKHPQKDSIRVELLVDACVSATFRADTAVLKMATEAHQIANKIGYNLGKIRSLNCIGNYYFSRALNDRAISYYLQALKMAEHRRDIQNIIIGKSNLANVFSHSKNDKKAIELLTECDRLLLQKGDSLAQNRAAILTNLANSYTNLNRNREAVAIYQKVLGICQKLNIGFGIALTLDNLGKCYLQLNQPQKALVFFEKAKIAIEKNEVDFVKGKNLKNLGRVYSLLNQPAKSLAYLNQAKTIAQQNEDNEGLSDIYWELQQNYARLNDFARAHLYLKNYVVLKDSLFNVEKNKTIEELNTKYETEKKEAQIKDLSQQKQIAQLESNRKNVLIYSILGGILALMAIAYFSFTRFRATKEAELLQTQLQEAQHRLEIEKKATESELKALKSQMNPHFMFNALNGIQEQFMYGDKNVANQQMGNFTDLTRQILSVSGKKRITLAAEIEILTKYLELEKMRFAEGFAYQITLSDTIDEDYHQIPPMLIQPFVENSIKHGLLHKQGPKQLSVRFELDKAEENIVVTVEDNGIGRQKSEEIKQKNPQKHNSFSTSATEERLRLLGGVLQAQNLVTYHDLTDGAANPTGTRVVITIALQF